MVLSNSVKNLHTRSRKSSSWTHWQDVRRVARPCRWACDRAIQLLCSSDSRFTLSVRSFKTTRPYTLSSLSAATRHSWGSNRRLDTTSFKLDESRYLCRARRTRTEGDSFFGHFLNCSTQCYISIPFWKLNFCQCYFILYVSLCGLRLMSNSHKQIQQIFLYFSCYGLQHINAHYY